MHLFKKLTLYSKISSSKFISNASFFLIDTQPKTDFMIF